MKSVITIIVALLLLPVCFAGVDLTLSKEPQCNEKGELTFTIENMGNAELKYLDSNTLVYAKGPEGIKRLNNAWSPGMIDAKGHIYDTKSTFTTFDPIFKSKASFAITVFYPKTLSVTERDIGRYDFSVECPGQRYQAAEFCPYLKIKIEECYQDEELFHAMFSVEKYVDYSINYLQDFSILPNYYINVKDMVIYDPMPPYQIRQTGKDTYVITAQVKDMKDQSTDTLHVSFLGCDNGMTKRCFPPHECKSDNDCESHQQCKNNTCEALECAPCDRITDHHCQMDCPQSQDSCLVPSCVSGGCGFERKEGCCSSDLDCSDNLSCTQDLCLRSNCSHAPVECIPSKQLCMLTVCEEPSGCIFQQNETCLQQPLAGAAYQAEESEPKQSNPLFWAIVLFSLCILTAAIIFVMKKEKAELKEAITELKSYYNHYFKKGKKN